MRTGKTDSNIATPSSKTIKFEKLALSDAHYEGRSVFRHEPNISTQPSINFFNMIILKALY